MNYRGTIAYRAGLGGNVPEGFLASVVPAWDFLINQTVMDRVSVDDKSGSIDFKGYHFMRGLSCMIHDSANQIAEGFLGDWVLMLDTDHVFMSDAFYEMVTTFEDNELDILTGFAQKRQPPYLPLIMKTNFSPLADFKPIIPGPIEKNTLIPIDAAGLACTMIRRKVFDAIDTKLGEMPFDLRNKFGVRVHYSEPGIFSGYSEKMPLPDLPEGRRYDEFYWEDISFYWRAALLGFKAYCAPWIKFYHIETRLITDDLMQIPEPNPIPQ